MFHAEDTSQGGRGLAFGGEEKGEFPKPLLNAPVNIPLPLARLEASLVSLSPALIPARESCCLVEAAVADPLWLVVSCLGSLWFGLLSAEVAV